MSEKGSEVELQKSAKSCIFELKSRRRLTDGNLKEERLNKIRTLII